MVNHALAFLLLQEDLYFSSFTLGLGTLDSCSVSLRLLRVYFSWLRGLSVSFGFWISSNTVVVLLAVEARVDKSISTTDLAVRVDLLKTFGVCTPSCAGNLFHNRHFSLRVLTDFANIRLKCKSFF